MIRINKITKDYIGSMGSLRALNEISLDADDGRFISIVGRSGCGKSTLLKILGGIEPPSSGSMEFDLPETDSRISMFGFCFQDPTLLPWLNVVENVLLPYRVSRTGSGAARTRALELLSIVGLADFVSARPWELSGGMQSRVALCRALVHAPPVLLLDEPFAALDALTRETLLFELQAIWWRLRPNTFLVTHSIHEAIMLSDEVVVMSDRPGTVRAVVPIDLERPRRPEHQYSDAFRNAEQVIKSIIFEEVGGASRETMDGSGRYTA
jgi:NitT/TauT family transport system ATP-binding protein